MGRRSFEILNKIKNGAIRVEDDAVVCSFEFG
jgi:hypothetical protein